MTRVNVPLDLRNMATLILHILAILASAGTKMPSAQTNITMKSQNLIFKALQVLSPTTLGQPVLAQ